jgi:hypothetical protein
MEVTETHFRWSKLRQNELNFLYALHHHVFSNFYIWLNLSCLEKTQERDMPNIIAIENRDLEILLSAKNYSRFNLVTPV